MLRYLCPFLFALMLPVLQAYSNEGMLCLVNKERTSRGLPAMGLDPLLTKAAQQHSDDQARMRSMSHSGSDGSQPSDRLTRIGFQWNRMAENVAYGYSDSVTCMQAWMKSQGHRENILGPCEMFGSGVGYSGSTPYYTQDFGTDGKGCRNVPKCNGGSYAGGSSDPAPAPSDGGSQSDSGSQYNSGGGGSYGGGQSDSGSQYNSGGGDSYGGGESNSGGQYNSGGGGSYGGGESNSGGQYNSGGGGSYGGGESNSGGQYNSGGDNSYGGGESNSGGHHHSGGGKHRRNKDHHWKHSGGKWSH